MIVLERPELWEKVSLKNAIDTAKNTVISSNFLVWKFWGKAQIPHSVPVSVYTVPFHKISTSGN